MRTTQVTVVCPDCGASAILMLTEPQVDDDASTQSLRFCCPERHRLTDLQMIELWAKVHQ